MNQRKALPTLVEYDGAGRPPNLYESPVASTGLHTVLVWIWVIVLGYSIADFPVKILWSYGGQTIAFCMLMAVPLFGLRNRLDSITLAMLGFGLAIALSFYVNSGIGHAPPGTALTRAVSIIAFGCFVFSRMPPASLKIAIAAIALGCVAVSIVGWYRFLTVTGGDLSEHALAYWGIRYTVSTRNGDVLYPLAATFFLPVVSWFPARAIGYVVTASGIGLSFARSAWISFAVFMTRRNTIHYVVVFLVVAICVAYLTGYEQLFAERLTSIVSPDQGSSNDERKMLLEYGVSHLSFFGNGVGNYSFGTGRSIPALDSTHTGENFFITMGVEMGVVPTAILASILLWAIMNSPYRRAGISLMVYLMMNNELDNVLLWLIFGVLVQSARLAKECPPPEIFEQPAQELSG